jgi:hypothetical protein
MNWPRSEEAMKKYPFWIPYKKRKNKISMLHDIGDDLEKKLINNRQKPN